MARDSFSIPRSPGGGDLLSIELLEEQARRLAALLSIGGRRGGGRAHLRRLAAHMRTLRGVYTTLAEDARHEAMSPAAEWLLDNFHIIAAAARDIQHDLPPSFFRRLPRVATDEFEGLPRIYALALELIGSSAGRLDAQRLQRFIGAFQSVTPLTIGELWAWPSALKLALLDHLRARGDVLASMRVHRVAADRLAATEEGERARPEAWPSEVHPAFVTRLLQRSRSLGALASSLHRQLAEALATRGQTVEDAIRAEGQHQATEQAGMANLIGSLRLISTFDWSEFFESVSLVEQVLQRDPAGVYGQMDFRSRDRYRHAVEELAVPTGEGQLLLALKSVERARQIHVKTPDARGSHVGYHLIGAGRREFEQSVAWRPTLRQRVRRSFFAAATPGYLGTIAAGTGVLVALAVAYAWIHGWRGPSLAFVALLTAVPASELAIQLIQRMVSYLIPPRRLPRIELHSVPPAARTMVIVPTILDSVARAEELVAHLEVQALGNVDPHIHFALLTDPPDAASETLPRDAETLAAARAGIEALNRKHADGGSNRFFLFHRRRQWNDREGRWMGWERKRGKIEEFNRLLRGATDTSFVASVGDPGVLPLVRYCITLDSDTRLPRGVARELIGIIIHPLNRASFSPQAGRVTEGYGILQPRVSVTFMSAAGSIFARLYAGHTGVDPYTTAVSDTYQDLFGEGIFTGKGLYDVDAFTAALDGSVPENALLSHDLFEGLYARTALVSDVELVDDYPSSVLSHARRQHRWIRGDWQILLWIFPLVPSLHGWTRNILPIIARWKIVDNLRRSLVAPMLLALLVCGWTVLPGPRWFWTMTVMGVVASQLLPVVAQILVGPARAQSIPVFLRNLRRDAVMALAQVLLSVTFLAFHAADSAHAIILTLVRLTATRRRMLEWETAASAAARTAGAAGQRMSRFVTEMAASPILATIVTLGIAAREPDALPAAFPFLLLWMLAPFVAYWLSVPVGERVRPLSDRERMRFRLTARRTWRYFDTFMVEVNHWLPPDNFQESEGARLALRTSPTNIGMGLLSMLAAHDLGYLSTAALLDRLDATLRTLESLERHQGHFLNWYDITTLAPLHPRYVSTVDSGNLAGALIALAQGIAGLDTDPQTRAQRLAGLADAAELLATTATAAADNQPAVANLRQAAQALAAVARAGGLDDRTATAMRTAGAPRAAAPADPADDIGYWCRSVLDALDGLTGDPPASSHQPAAIAARLSAMADAMRFDFLYDRRRRIFSIGYRLADAEGPGRLDASFYDLLASEARLASFVAIAQGDVPQHHWFHLGRLVTNVDGRATLMSWGGTMFEYLMPQLLMRSFPGTLLEQSCRASVGRQIEYGRQRHVPWGISESAYAFTDREGNYQYRAFGVPGLGLRRGLATDLVIAPYATALAAIVSPAAAADNMARLAEAQLEGRFGFYEALDYNPRGRTADQDPEAAGRPSVVRAFFAHHQGMSLVALTNVICGDPFVSRFHADPRIQATELLLQERVPREAILSEPRPAEATTAPPSLPVFASRRFQSPHTTSVHTHFLSNGRYTTAVTAAGGGFSFWGDLAVTRRRDDPTADAGAHYIYLRDSWSNRIWSATYQPVCREPDQFDATFDLDKATFRRRDTDIESQLEITVSSEDDVEVRRLTLANRGAETREIEVTSYAEIVLGRPEDDLAHPAFGKLFIQTEFDAQSAGLIFTRRPRAADEPHVVGFHVLGIDGPRLGGAVEWETDRARFIGRGRTPANPIVLDGRALSGTTGAVLDPIGALRERIRLPPGAVVRATFATGVAPDRAAALALARKYRDGSTAARAFSMAFTHVHITLQNLGFSDEQAILFDRLASRVFGSDTSCISPPDLAANIFGQQNLWGKGISGDLPILLLRLTDANALALARQVLRAQAYWRVKGLRADVILLNEHPADYLDETQQMLSALAQEPQWAGWLGRPGGIFVLRTEGMPGADRRLLFAVARAVVDGDLGNLASQLERPAPWLFAGHDVPRTATLRSPAGAAQPLEVPALAMETGLGGFTLDGREYVIVMDGDRETPLPWSNVLANPTFGTIVSNGGAAFTWAVNSRENRLTPFANDPLSDPTGEGLYLRDEESGAVWAATPGLLPRRPDGGRWIVRHGAGVTRFEHAVEGLHQELVVAVAPEDPVKLAALTLTNTGDRLRKLSVFGYVEWCLGPPLAGERRFVVTERDDATGAVPRAQHLQHTIPRRRRVLARQRARGVAHGRPQRVHRAEPDGRRAGGALSRAARGPDRRRTGSVRGAADRHRDSAGRVAHGRLRARRGARPGPRHRAGGPLRHGVAGGDVARRGRSCVGRHPRRRPGPHAGRFVRSDREPLAALPDAQLPRVGALRPLSARRRVRLPRSAPGRPRADVHPAGSLPRAAVARGVQAVRRRRRAALVASAGGTRHPYALLGRSALAPVCRGPVRVADRRHGGARRGRRLPRRHAARSRPDGELRPPAGLARDGAALRACHPRHRARDEVRGARASAHGLGRLERRDEPRGLSGPRRERLARLVPRHRAERVRADLRGPRARRPRPAVSRRGQVAHGDAGARMGRQLVPARLFRRWQSARLRAERGVQARFADAVVVGPLAGSAATAGAARHGGGPRPPGPARRSTRAAADAPLRSDGARSGLHQGVRAGDPRKRRAVHARRAVDRHRARPSRSRQRGDGAVPHDQPDQSHAHAGGRRAVPRRAVRGRGRRLRPPDARGPRRMDVVHGLGGLDVPGRRRRPARASPARLDDEREPVHPHRVAALLGGLDDRRHAVPHQRDESPAAVLRRGLGGSRRSRGRSARHPAGGRRRRARGADRAGSWRVHPCVPGCPGGSDRRHRARRVSVRRTRNCSRVPSLSWCQSTRTV